MSLRADLLKGRRIAIGGDADPELSDELAGLGAELVPLPAEGLGEDEERVGEWAHVHEPLHALVYRAGFGAGGDRALAAALDQAWAAVREVAVGALIEAERPGKIVLIAPRTDAGALAEAAAAGLENLARTLSVEWARYQVSAVMVAPGRAATAQDLVTLVCYLVSEAGEYLSGCRLELGMLR
jgi:NAD(P)-dependent dehydrogenase (short-subunit alcohol dehydrogenase family)